MRFYIYHALSSILYSQVLSVVIDYVLSSIIHYQWVSVVMYGALSSIICCYKWWLIMDYASSSILTLHWLRAFINRVLWSIRSCHISCVSFTLSRTSFHISYVSVDKELSSILHYHRLWAVWRCHLSSFTIHYESHPSRIIINYDELSFRKL